MAINCVLSAEKETEERYNYQDNLDNYIKEVSKYKNLTQEEEIEAAKSAKEGSVEAKQKIIKANLKLVIIIAKKLIYTSKLPMIDLIQEGNIGLMVAVEKFNWKFGYRFATYATWWIRQAMFKAISEQSHSVKIPVYIQETLSKYSKIKAEIEKDGNTTANIEDIAKKMNINAERIYNYINANKNTLSLEADYETRNGSEVKLVDIIEDKKNSVSSNIEGENLKREIVEILKDLKDREQKVIILRFGLYDGEKKTLEEIGKSYGVTKECIRQTEARALNKLRKNKNTVSLYQDYLN